MNLVDLLDSLLGYCEHCESLLPCVQFDLWNWLKLLISSGLLIIGLSKRFSLEGAFREMPSCSENKGSFEKSLQCSSMFSLYRDLFDESLGIPNESYSANVQPKGGRSTVEHLNGLVIFN